MVKVKVDIFFKDGWNEDASVKKKKEKRKGEKKRNKKVVAERKETMNNVTDFFSDCDRLRKLDPPPHS